MKSTHIFQLPFAFLTITTLINQVMCDTSSMNPTFNNFSTSTFIIANHFGPSCLFFYCIDLTLRLMASLWQATLRSILGILAIVQEKHQWYVFHNLIRLSLNFISKFFPTIADRGLDLLNNLTFLMSDSIGFEFFLPHHVSNPMIWWLSYYNH